MVRRVRRARFLLPRAPCSGTVAVSYRRDRHVKVLAVACDSRAVRVLATQKIHALVFELKRLLRRRDVLFSWVPQRKPQQLPIVKRITRGRQVLD